jgi:hypothetical protein
MKISRVIQFVIAAAMYSIGCIALLDQAIFPFTTICFGLSPVVLMRRSELTRPVLNRELWMAFGVLAALVALIILGNLLIPKSAGEHLFRSPAFVIPLWVLLMSGLFWMWRREKRLLMHSKLPTPV